MCCAIALKLEAFLSIAVGEHMQLNNHEGPPLTLGASACDAIGKLFQSKHIRADASVVSTT